MNCKKFAGKLGAYQDGALNAEVAERIRAHLESCAACREELAALERLSDLIRPELAHADAPEGFAQRVMERLPEGRLAFRRRSLISVFAWSAAALLLVVGALVFRCVSLRQPASIAKREHPPAIHARQPERASGKPTATGVEAPPIHLWHKPKGEPVRRRLPATYTVRGQALRKPSAPRHGSDEGRQTLTPADMERLEELAARYRLANAGIELARVPIGEEKTATPGTVEREPSAGRSESKDRKPGIKFVARSQDGRFSIGVTLE